MFHPEELIEQIHDLPHGSERMSALQSAITEADNASSHRRSARRRRVSTRRRCCQCRSWSATIISCGLTSRSLAFPSSSRKFELRSHQRRLQDLHGNRRNVHVDPEGACEIPSRAVAAAEGEARHRRGKFVQEAVIQAESHVQEESGQGVFGRRVG